MVDEREAVTWRVHRARREPARAMAAVAAAIAAGVGAFLVFGSFLSALIATGLILGSVGEFLFPIRYQLSPAGAEARGLFHWRRIAWSEVKRVATDADAILLSPLARPSRRDAFRGVLLWCESDGPLTRGGGRSAARGRPGAGGDRSPRPSDIACADALRREAICDAVRHYRNAADAT